MNVSFLSDQMDLAAEELKDVPDYELAETDLKSLDEVFADLKLYCPELVKYALEGNYLKELNRLVEILRKKLNLAVMAGHWLKQGDEKFNEQELAIYYLKDLVRRIGMNLDGDHMETFEGKPGELIECHLPPAVAHDLYRVSYPLVVDRGLQELKGEWKEAPLPPENLNHDIFFGRVDTTSKYLPGTILKIDENGDPKVVSTPPDLNANPDTVRKVEIAVRQEVTRQGHQVASLRAWPTGREDLVSVELRVVDATRGFDNSALKDAIGSVLRPTVPSKVQAATEVAKNFLKFPQALKL